MMAMISSCSGMRGVAPAFERDRRAGAAVAPAVVDLGGRPRRFGAGAVASVGAASAAGAAEACAAGVGAAGEGICLRREGVQAPGELVDARAQGSHRLAIGRRGGRGLTTASGIEPLLDPVRHHLAGSHARLGGEQLERRQAAWVQPNRHAAVVAVAGDVSAVRWPLRRAIAIVGPGRPSLVVAGVALVAWRPIRPRSAWPIRPRSAGRPPPDPPPPGREPPWRRSGRRSYVIGRTLVVRSPVRQSRAASHGAGSEPAAAASATATPASAEAAAAGR